MRRLSLLSPHHVAEAYRQAYETCWMEGDLLPRASLSGVGDYMEAASVVAKTATAGNGLRLHCGHEKRLQRHSR
jgi:hypothetical protein